MVGLCESRHLTDDGLERHGGAQKLFLQTQEQPSFPLLVSFRLFCPILISIYVTTVPYVNVDATI